jgi:L-amino acid N-acyltransferase YncA
VIIRDAAPADWPRIWPFFHAIVAAGDTFAYPLDLTYEQSRDLWMLEAPKRTTVAVDDDGVILGSATMYANRGGNGDHVASASYMVDPELAGRGVGRALVEDSLTWARAQGFRGMQFNAVAETNVYAVKLYQKLGFEIIGTVPEAFNHPTTGYVGLHVMYIKL